LNYECPLGIKFPESKSYLAGEEAFSIEEIEVY
jgi:hypothetical protein